MESQVHACSLGSDGSQGSAIAIVSRRSLRARNFAGGGTRRMWRYIDPTSTTVRGRQQFTVKQYPAFSAADETQLIDAGDRPRGVGGNAADLSPWFDRLKHELRLISRNRSYQGRFSYDRGERHAAVELWQIWHCPIQLPAESPVVAGEQHQRQACTLFSPVSHRQETALSVFKRRQVICCAHRLLCRGGARHSDFLPRS